MLRVSRRLTTALLWLAIALMPMRALAGAWMPMTAPTTPSAMAQGMAAHEQLQATLSATPCHGDASALNIDGEAAQSGQPSGHNCAMCELCHATALQMADTALAACALPAVLLPVMTAAPIEPRSPERLYKPPRQLLA